MKQCLEFVAWSCDLGPDDLSPRVLCHLLESDANTHVDDPSKLFRSP